jgi:(p)ppGpp synthase/HD superfamily hydrolase
MTLQEKARVFALAAHTAIGQKRKYSGEHYIVHPERVARTVAKFGGTEEMIAAAYLHDILEDTQIEETFIFAEFGPEVCDLVVELTDVSKPEDGNRATRKGIDADRLGKVSEQAQIIKLADLLDNSEDILANDPSFAKVFLKEKENILDKMTKVKDHPLVEQVKAFTSAKNPD